MIIAFFPCIYFEAMQMTYFSFDSLNLRTLSTSQKYDKVIERVENRSKFYLLLWKLFAVCEKRGLRLIMENPATQPHYLLLTQNFIRPTFIDKDRQRRGDYFRKPTAYWFLNIERTFGESYQSPSKRKIVNNCKRGAKAGICSEERSLISPDYARNFICDFILGRPQEHSLNHLNLFQQLD